MALEDSFGVDPETAETALDGDAGEGTSVEEQKSALEEGVEEPQAEAAAEPEAPAASWNFQFGDRTFTSPEEAQQYFSSWNGRLAKQAQQLREFQQENQRWAEWHAAQQANGNQKPETEPAKPEAPKEFVDSFDWKYVEELLREGKGTKAVQYIAWQNGELLKQQLDSLKSEIRGELDSTIGPMREAEAANEFAVELMLAAKNAINSDGTSLFPEFQEGEPTYDSDFVKLFGNVWRQLPPQLAFDPDGHGVELAYARARAQYQPATPAVDPRREAAERAAASVGAASRDAQGRFISRTAAQATAIGGSQPGEPADANAGRSIADFKRDLRNAGKVNSAFGVME